MPRLSPSLVCLAILSSACGCILGSGPDQAKDEPAPAKEPATDPGDRKSSEGRVATEWQKHMLTALAKEPAGSRAYGLFSEGGWSNAGQVMVLVSQDGTSQRLLVVPNNKQQAAPERSLTKAEWAKLAPRLEGATKLEDIDIEAFDLLIYEYVHAEKPADGAPVVVDRLYIKNPGTKKAPEHDALVDAFQALKGAAE